MTSSFNILYIVLISNNHRHNIRSILIVWAI